MKSSIYISSEKIEVVGYSGVGLDISVNGYMCSPLPEGTMINGKITDPSLLTECLIDIRRRNPGLFDNPTLIVDGSSIFSKRISVPKLNKWQYLQLVKNEFSDNSQSSDEDNLVCDYQQLGKPGVTSSAILACAADKSQVETYIATFKEAGINLKAIRIGVQAIQHYVDSRPDLQNMTFVLNIIDGFTMLSMIFNNGINVFMSRTRMYGEDSEQLLQNVLDNLSGLIQFNRSQNFNEMTHSFYLGLSKNNLELLKRINPYTGGMSSFSNIEVDILDIFSGYGNPPEDEHFAYLNALLDNNSIDLIRGCKTIEKLKKRQRPKKYWVPAFACIVVLLAIPAAFLYMRIYNTNNDIDGVNSYLTNSDVVAKSEELDNLIEETAGYRYVINQLNGKKELENSMPTVSNQILDLVTGTHADKVSVIRFDFNEDAGILSVSGSSASEVDSAAYVDALKSSDLVDDVKYTGYSYNNKGEYNFSIALKLAITEVDQ